MGIYKDRQAVPMKTRYVSMNPTLEEILLGSYTVGFYTGFPRVL